MTATLTPTTSRVTAVDGWAVRDMPDGSQVRARLIHDPNHPEPERGRGMWNEGVSLVRHRDGYGGAEMDEHDGLRAILDRVNHDGRYWWVERHDANDIEAGNRMWDPEKTMEENWRRTEHDLHGEANAHEFIARYLRIFHDVQYAALHHHQGYSQSDWAEVWVIAEGIEGNADPEGIARATFDEWDAWAKGDCYGVESETRSLLDAMDAYDDEGWTEHESPHFGHYGDDAASEVLAEALDVSADDLPSIYDVMTRD